MEFDAKMLWAELVGGPWWVD